MFPLEMNQKNCFYFDKSNFTQIYHHALGPIDECLGVFNKYIYDQPFKVVLNPVMLDALKNMDESLSILKTLPSTYGSLSPGRGKGPLYVIIFQKVTTLYDVICLCILGFSTVLVHLELLDL